MIPTPAPPGPLAKFFAFVTGALLLLLGLMFSVVLLAVVAVLGLCAWGYFWWKTRALRKAMREQPLRTEGGGDIIEGEAVIVEECRVGTTGVLPGDLAKK